MVTQMSPADLWATGGVHFGLVRSHSQNGLQRRVSKSPLDKSVIQNETERYHPILNDYPAEFVLDIIRFDCAGVDKGLTM